MARPWRKLGCSVAEILTFREGPFWIAAWARYDIVAQGSTELEASDRLLRSIAATAIIYAKHGEPPFATTPTPSERTLARWRAAHALAHGESGGRHG